MIPTAYSAQFLSDLQTLGGTWGTSIVFGGAWQGSLQDPGDPGGGAIEGSLVTALADLANAAYTDTTDAAEALGWTPVAEVSTTALGPDLLNNNFHAYEALVDGKRTLSLAFSGTQDIPDILLQPFGQWDDVFERQRDAIRDVLTWAKNAGARGETPFAETVITGHSLGGILVEMLMADQEFATDPLIEAAWGVTFGSPGSVATLQNDDRLLNFVTLGDPVAALSQDSFFNLDPDDLDLKSFTERMIEGAGLITDSVTSPASVATRITSDLGSLVPARDGHDITMVQVPRDAAETFLFDGFGVDRHFMTAKAGQGGYLTTVNRVYDGHGKGRAGFADLEQWLSRDSSGYYIDRRPGTDLEALTELVVVLPEFAGLLLLDKLPIASTISYVAGGANAITNFGAAVQDGVLAVGQGAATVVSGAFDSLSTSLEANGKRQGTIELFYQDTEFGQKNVTVEKGSAIISIDLDLDGTPEATTRLEGNFRTDRFFVLPEEDGTRIVYARRAETDTSSASDQAFGAAKADTISGRRGDDWLFGEGGNDILRGGQGNDRLDGGAGKDRLVGDAGTDIIEGGGGADTLAGGKGGDRLSGGKGADTIGGGQGKDRLDGGKGQDALKGGAGADRFVFARGDGGDAIADWTPGQDVIVFKSGAKNLKALDIQRDGADTLINYGKPGDVIRLQEIRPADFDTSDIAFL